MKLCSEIPRITFARELNKNGEYFHFYDKCCNDHRYWKYVSLKVEKHHEMIENFGQQLWESVYATFKNERVKHES